MADRGVVVELAVDGRGARAPLFWRSDEREFAERAWWVEVADVG